MPATDAESPAVSASVPRRWGWRPKVQWFAAEILVVVAGVLIALALNAWWGRGKIKLSRPPVVSVLRLNGHLLGVENEYWHLMFRFSSEGTRHNILER